MSTDQMLSVKKGIAKGLLTPKELERFAIVALACADYSKVDWDVCASESGNTKDSFRVMFNNTLKKLKKNGCYVGADDVDTAAGDSNAAVRETPNKKGGRKREDAEEDESSAQSTPKKPRGRGKNVKKEIVEKHIQQIEGQVKTEMDEDEHMV